MDKRTDSGTAPLIQEQRHALRALRDCGVIRARGVAAYRSEVYCAVEMGRKGIGIGLKPSYFAQAVKNLEGAGIKRDDLFTEAEAAE